MRGESDWRGGRTQMFEETSKRIRALGERTAN